MFKVWSVNICFKGWYWVEFQTWDFSVRFPLLIYDDLYYMNSTRFAIIFWGKHISVSYLKQFFFEVMFSLGIFTLYICWSSFISWKSLNAKKPKLFDMKTTHFHAPSAPRIKQQCVRHNAIFMIDAGACHDVLHKPGNLIMMISIGHEVLMMCHGL